MDPIKLNFYTEAYEKENRSFKLVEEFTPSLLKLPVTGKFYSRYEGLAEQTVPEEYIKLIEKRKEKLPRDIYPFRPPAVNMDYGWFVEPLVPRSTDPRLYFPAKHCKFIEIELNMRYIDRGIIKKKFVGIPFKT